MKMTKKSKKRALISSLVVMAICFTMLIGSTFAWFTDSASSTGNVITTGTLDVKLTQKDANGNYTEVTGPVFDNVLWEPNATYVEYFRIENAGTLALKLGVALNVTNVTKNLNEVLEYAVVEGTTVSGWTSGTAVAVGNNVTTIDGLTLAPQATYDFALVVHMDHNAGNTYQDASITFDVNVAATQATYESDSFGTDYDADAEYAAVVSNAAELAEALNAAAGKVVSIKLTEDVTMDAPAAIANNATVTLDLNGKTLDYDSTTQNESMISNKGNLTINDTVGTGVINYNYTGAADPNYTTGNYTIDNYGTLTVNGGYITVAKLSQHAKYPINNNSTSSDATVIINGGHLYNYNTSAIRQFCNSTVYKNTVIINGGLVEGYSAIWIQNPTSNKATNCALVINGGEIKSTAKAYVEGTAELQDVASGVYFTNNNTAWSADSYVEINGGIFNENLDLSAAPANTVVGAGATFNGRYN